MYFVFTQDFKKIETISLRPHVCMYTLHSHDSDEVVSLISGDESVVCSPMQWMLYSTAIPAIIIIMFCYKTVDLY